MKSNPDSSSLKESQAVGQIPDASGGDKPHEINGQHTLSQGAETGMHESAQEHMMQSTLAGTVSKPYPVAGAKSAVK